MMKMREVVTEKEFQETIASGSTVVLFTADWCPDCQHIYPFMDEVEANYADTIKMVKVDRDKLMDLCQQYDIFGIPSFVAFKDGKETVRFVNKLSKSREEIEHFLDRVKKVTEALHKYEA